MSVEKEDIANFDFNAKEEFKSQACVCLACMVHILIGNMGI